MFNKNLQIGVQPNWVTVGVQGLGLGLNWGSSTLDTKMKDFKKDIQAMNENALYGTFLID